MPAHGAARSSGPAAVPCRSSRAAAPRRGRDPAVAPAAADSAAAAAAADVVAPLPPGVDATPAGPKALAALTEARKYLGTPYLWGGSKPSTGFDCSGLMQWAYHQAGISIGRVTTQQIHDGVAVDRQHLRAGDMVFFQDSSGYVHHVGMYIGDDKFLHAPHTGDVVKISSLDEPYYAHQFAGGRRMDTSAPVDAAGARSRRPGRRRPSRSGRAPPRPRRPRRPPQPRRPAPAAGARAASRRWPRAARRGRPRSTVQVLKAVEAPTAQSRRPPAAAAARHRRCAAARSGPARGRLGRRLSRRRCPARAVRRPGWRPPPRRPACRRSCRSWLR